MEHKNKILFFGSMVAILNVFDGFATHYGMKNHFIEELNPLMLYLIESSPVLFLSTKMALSILILLFSYKVIRKSKPKFQTLFCLTLMGVCFIYSGILGMHILWIATL